MFKLRSTIVAVLVSLLTALPSQAYWNVLDKSNNQFVVSVDEVVESPVDNSIYAYVEYGIISKIVRWKDGGTNSYIASFTPRSYIDLDMASDLVFMASLPSSFKVNYIDYDGLVKSDVINHGDKVSVVNSLDFQDIQSQNVINNSVTQVLSSSVNQDYSTSITVAPATTSDPNKTVEIQVIANGMSFTSIATDNTSTPITINNLPSNQYVTVQTIYKGGMEFQAKPYQEVQEVPIVTPDANVPVFLNARDVVEDKSTIAAPQGQVTVNGDTKSATISFAPINNFDSSKTMASVMVVGPNGETTSIGIDGNGGTVNVSDLLATANYSLKVVIRDIDSGEETVISGSKL